MALAEPVVRPAHRVGKFCSFNLEIYRNWYKPHFALELVEELVVLIVCADPKPINPIPFPQTKGSIIDIDSHRINRLGATYFFKLQTGMKRVHLEEPIFRTGLIPYRFRDAPEALQKPGVEIGLHKVSGSSS